MEKGIVNMPIDNFDPVVFQGAFEKWFKQCNDLYKDDGRLELGYCLTYKFGRKYISIIALTDNQKMQCGFVDMETGNILKSASWGKPETKHPRGNIFDEHGGMKYIAWTGPMYMDSITRIQRDEEDEEDAWEGWDDPRNYTHFNDDIDNIPEGELNEARVTRKSLRNYPHID